MKFVLEINLDLPLNFYLSPLIGSNSAPDKSKKETSMSNEIKYTLKPFGTGKLSANLAHLCAQGKIGEMLITSGATQSAVASFAAKLALAIQAKGGKEAEITAAFEQTSVCNASALKQALAACTIEVEGGKPQSVEDFWKSKGGTSSVPSITNLLDL